jgi:hypothetical protein
MNRAAAGAASCAAAARTIARVCARGCAACVRVCGRACGVCVRVCARVCVLCGVRCGVDWMGRRSDALRTSSARARCACSEVRQPQPHPRRDSRHLSLSIRAMRNLRMQANAWAPTVHRGGLACMRRIVCCMSHAVLPQCHCAQRCTVLCRYFGRCAHRHAGGPHGAAVCVAVHVQRGKRLCSA